MIGFWNKAVYITYLGAFFAVAGLIMFFETNNPDYAFIGMFLAMVCDTFDGKVARSIPNRTEKEKEFGIEIDSLGDIIDFITVPALTIYKIIKDNGNMNKVVIAILALYCVCGIIRLAYFNVAMANKDKAIDYYTGVPVPVGVGIFAIVWLLAKFNVIVPATESLIYTLLVPIVGYLHISKLRIKKITSNWFYITVIVLSLIAILFAIVF